MIRYIVTRLLLMLPTLLGVLTATFVLVQFVPGGPVEQAISELRQQRQESGRGGDIDAAQVEAIKKLYGFDKPPAERFWLTVSSFARFDFGTSFQNNQDMWSVIKSKLPVSISLGSGPFLPPTCCRSRSAWPRRCARGRASTPGRRSPCWPASRCRASCSAWC